MKSNPKTNDAVALLSDEVESGLARGQVGTVVEELDASSVLVEFSSDDGKAYAISPISSA